MVIDIMETGRFKGKKEKDISAFSRVRMRSVQVSPAGSCSLAPGGFKLLSTGICRMFVYGGWAGRGELKGEISVGILMCVGINYQTQNIH